jgi:hypothetical protein
MPGARCRISWMRKTREATLAPPRAVGSCGRVRRARPFPAIHAADPPDARLRTRIKRDCGRRGASSCRTSRSVRNSRRAARRLRRFHSAAAPAGVVASTGSCSTCSTATSCGTTKHLKLDRPGSSEQVNHRAWSWSAARRQSRASEVRHPLLLVRAKPAGRPSDAPRHPRPLRAGLPLRRVSRGQGAPQRAVPRATPGRDCGQTARTSEQAPDAANVAPDRRRLLPPRRLQRRTVARHSRW